MAKRTLSFHIQGMQCAGCEAIINDAVQALPGVDTVSASHAAQVVQVSFDDTLITASAILACIENKGYRYGEVDSRPKTGIEVKQLGMFIVLLLVVGGIVFWGKSLMPGLMKQFDATLGYGVIFTVGFFTGFHCIGMCGSFVVSYTQGVVEKGRRAVFFAHLLYALGKNTSYALLGAAFGALGAVITVTPYMRGIAAIIAGGFLLLFGLGMLNLLPRIRLSSLGSQSKTVTQKVYQDIKPRRNPLLIGFLSGFLLGCGPLQAMYVMAMGSADPKQGALLLLSFGTGTLIPLMTFGMLASVLSSKVLRQLRSVSAILVMVMGVMMINRGVQMSQTNQSNAPTQAAHTMH